MALEHAGGGSLDQWMPASWEQLLGYVMPLLDGLAHAHARDLIHRDLKPENLMLCRPDELRPGLKIADFGLAWATDRDRKGARIAGTPAFISPRRRFTIHYLQAFTARLLDGTEAALPHIRAAQQIQGLSAEDQERSDTFAMETLTILGQFDKASALLGPYEGVATGRVQLQRGRLAFATEDLATAQTHFSWVFEHSDAEQERGVAANSLGMVHQGLGNLPASSEWFDRAAVLLRPDQRTAPLGNSAILNLQRGAFAKAKNSGLAALQESHGTDSLQYSCYLAAITALAAIGDHDTAVFRHTRARGLYYFQRFTPRFPDAVRACLDAVGTVDDPDARSFVDRVRRHLDGEV